VSSSPSTCGSTSTNTERQPPSEDALSCRAPTRSRADGRQMTVAGEGVIGRPARRLGCGYLDEVLEDHLGRECRGPSTGSPTVTGGDGSRTTATYLSDSPGQICRRSTLSLTFTAEIRSLLVPDRCSPATVGDREGLSGSMLATRLTSSGRMDPIPGAPAGSSNRDDPGADRRLRSRSLTTIPDTSTEPRPAPVVSSRTQAVVDSLGSFASANQLQDGCRRAVESVPFRGLR
jgi:hypothetical protein